MLIASKSETCVQKRVTVDELLATPFSMRSEVEKCRIISNGRPAPLIRTKDHWQEGALQGKRNVFEELQQRRQKMFDTTKSLYDDLPWLTASATTQRFYCWPCILFNFPQIPDVWHVSGSSDIFVLKTFVTEHKLSVEHLNAMCQYQTWQNHDTTGSKENRSEYGKKNLNVIRRLTDVVFTVASMQLPPKDFNNYRSELDIKECINSLQLLRKYEVDTSCTDEAINLLQNSPDFVVNLMKAIVQVIKQTIAREIKSCKYVSIILNLHSNVKLKAQISTVLRYVVNGRVCERFVEFSHLFENVSVESLYKHVTRIAQEFNINSKCIALSLDGGILTFGDVCTLVIKCHTKLECCVFVPYYSHTVDEVLQISLSSSHKKLESFFKIMADFHTSFWDSNSGFSVAFNRYLSRSNINYVNICPRNRNGWFAASDFIICVQKHRQMFVSFLNEASSFDYTLTAGDIAKALGFREFLNDILTVFLLKLFSKIFLLTSTLNTALSNHSPERIVTTQTVLTLLNGLFAIKERDFESLFNAAFEEIGKDTGRKSSEDKCCPLFKLTLKIVMGEVEMRYRYSHVDKFQFCRLFDLEEEGGFNIEKTTNRYRDLAQMYKLNYDLSQTLHEMQTVSNCNAFSKKSVYEFHQYLAESAYKYAFKALFDVSELILALPFKPASLMNESSIKEKIDKWSFGSTQKSYAEDTDIIFIECDNLTKIKQSQTFYAQVIANMH